MDDDVSIRFFPESYKKPIEKKIVHGILAILANLVIFIGLLKKILKVKVSL